MILLCKWFGITCLAGTLSGHAYVHDGDTIYIANQPVRLYGIDAEELDEPNGYAARDHLRSLIGDRLVTCSWSGWSYKRKVGLCHVGTDYTLNQRMVEDGYALDCARYSGGLYRSAEPPGARKRLLQKGYC